MTIAVAPVRDALPSGFDALRDAARAERHTHMERLAGEWLSGVNRFDAAGEALLAAFVGSALVGIGGMTADPTNRSALRMRRFYVLPAWRGRGVGRSLADALLRAARQTVVLNAPNAAAAQFWEALGFVPDRCDGHTHIRRWSG